MVFPELELTVVCRFMSTPVGFRYLYSADYIDREMDVWFNVCDTAIWGQKGWLTQGIPDEERSLRSGD